MELVEMTSACSKRFGDEKALQLIKDAGFDGFDYTMDAAYDILFNDGYIEHVKKIKKLSDEIGLPCLQAHAPSPLMRTIQDVLPLTDIFLRSIEIASMLECKYLVVHPGAFLTAEENKIHIYDKLLPYAKEKGVIIATENMFKWKDATETETVPASCGTAKDFAYHMQVIKHENFCACMDIGHAEMVNCEGAVKIIKALGNNIGCLHVHDNDLFDDCHTFPFVGNVNWKEVTKALKDIGYKGNLTFEADAFMKNYPDELIPACLSLLEKTGRYLINLIEN